MDRDERRKRLEEKRSKLAEIKARRQGGDDTPTASDVAMEPAQSYQETLTMASDIIGEDIRPRSSVRSVSPARFALSPAVDVPAVDTAAPLRKLPHLETVPLEVIAFRQPASVTYCKETQTASVAEDSSDNEGDDGSARRVDKMDVEKDVDESREPVRPSELTPAQKKELFARPDFAEFLVESSRLVERVLGGLEEWVFDVMHVGIAAMSLTCRCLVVVI